MMVERVRLHAVAMLLIGSRASRRGLTALWGGR